MPFFQRTIINSDGVVVRERRSKKRRKHKNNRDYHRDAMPKRNSTSNRSLHSLGIYKGAHIMSPSTKLPSKSPVNEIELNYSSPVDRSANPQLSHLNR
jgi:hypothetical protein